MYLKVTSAKKELCFAEVHSFKIFSIEAESKDEIVRKLKYAPDFVNFQNNFEGKQRFLVISLYNAKNVYHNKSKHGIVTPVDKSIKIYLLNDKGQTIDIINPTLLDDVQNNPLNEEEIDCVERDQGDSKLKVIDSNIQENENDNKQIAN